MPLFIMPRGLNVNIGYKTRCCHQVNRKQNTTTTTAQHDWNTVGRQLNKESPSLNGRKQTNINIGQGDSDRRMAHVHYCCPIISCC